MAERARREVETNWDAAAITQRLVEKYLEMIRNNESRRAGVDAAPEPRAASIMRHG